MDEQLDLVYRVLDDQLIDCDGRRCGRVDDVEFSPADPGSAPKLHAILSGSGVWSRRLPRPLRRLGTVLFGTGTAGKDVIRVPWEQVEEITTAVHLKSKARELGLAQGDERDARLVEKLPRS